MRKVLAAAAILVCFGSFTAGQIANAGFSESVEYQPRVVTKAQQEKPEKEKKKKDKKSGAQTGAPPQNDAGDALQTADAAEIKEELITVPVSVFDRDGKFIGNLQKTDFEIYAGGKRQEITGFEAAKDEAVSVILMIDVSASTTYDIETIQNCAVAVVEQLRADDKVLVVEFNEKTVVLAELTADRATIYKAIRAAKFGNGTSLYGAVKSTFEKRINSIQGRKAVVLLTDGVDTTSTSASYKSSLLAAEMSDAEVYPVYFDTLDKNSKSHSAVSNIILNGVIYGGSSVSPEAEYELGRNYLDDIALLSGGKRLVVKKEKGKGTARVENIGANLRQQYLITFKTSEIAKTGERKILKARVNRPALSVQARGSYIAGTSVR